MLHRHCFQRAISRLFLLSGSSSFRALHPARASTEPLRASCRAPNAIRLLHHPEASENAIYNQQSSEQSGAQHLPAGRMRTLGAHPWAPWVCMGPSPLGKRFGELLQCAPRGLFPLHFHTSTLFSRLTSSLPGLEDKTKVFSPSLACAARQQGAVPQAEPVPGTAVLRPADKQPRRCNELPRSSSPPCCSIIQASS